MQIIKSFRDIAAAGFLLFGLLLLGIRLYESAHIYGSVLICLTQILFPILWPATLTFFIAFAVLALVYMILRIADRRKRERMEV